MIHVQLSLGDEVWNLDDRREGVVLTQLDLGFPVVREVSAALSTQDGVFDTTNYHGARAVSMEGGFAQSPVFGSRQAVADRFLKMLAASSRSRLTYSIDGQPERFLDLRPSDFSGPLTNPITTRWAATWVAPDPIAYSVNEHAQILWPESERPGFTFDVAMDLAFPKVIGGVGLVWVENNGDYRTFPLLRVFGPCLNPRLIFVDAGGYVALNTRIYNGEWYDINLKDHSVYAMSDPRADRYNEIDFVNTIWPGFEPGRSLFRFNADEHANPCQVHVFWRDAYLT